MKPTNNSTVAWIWVSVNLMWITLVLSAYYVVQRPLGPDFAASLAQLQQHWQGASISLSSLVSSFLDLLAALWILLVLLGIGLWWWRWLGPKNASPAERLVFSVGAGTATVGLLVLLFGLLGLLQVGVLYGLMIFLSIAAAVQLVRQRRLLTLPGMPAPLRLYLLLAFGMALTIALLPPTGWDSLSYHLKGPQLYLEAGRIYPGIDIFSLNFPFLMEMLFLLGMALRSDVTAQLIHLSTIPLLAATVYLLARRILKLSGGWTAVALLCAIPAIWFYGPWAYNDIALAWATAGALYAFARSREPAGNAWLLWAGLFTGLAMSFKYTSVTIPLFLGAWLLWERRRQPALLRADLWTYALPALLVALPWYVKNYFFTGNPVYPFVFNGLFWDDFRAAANSLPGSGIGINLAALLRIPLDLTLGTRDVSEGGPIGPLYLAFLPLLVQTLWSRRRSLPVRAWALLLFAIFHFLLWTLGVISSANLWQGRLMLPGLVVLCPLLTWTLQQAGRYDHPQFSPRRLMTLIVGVTLLLGLVTQFSSWVSHDPLLTIVTDNDRQDYLTRRLGTLYQVSLALEDQLPEESVVQFLWEPRTYYCTLPCRGDHILDRYAHLEFLHGDAAGIASALRADGITHVLVHESGLQFLRQVQTSRLIPADLEMYQQFVGDYLTPVETWGQAYTLYKLESP